MAEVNAVDAPVPQTQSLPTTPVAVAVQRTDLFADAAAIWAALQGALTPKIAALLLPEEFVRKFTIAVYGLSEGRVVAQNRPYVAPEGPFAVAKTGDGPQAQFRLCRKMLIGMTPTWTHCAGRIRMRAWRFMSAPTLNCKRRLKSWV